MLKMLKMLLLMLMVVFMRMMFENRDYRKIGLNCGEYEVVSLVSTWMGDRPFDI